MRGIRFRLETPYFAAFRKPVSTSALDTYPIPPITTIKGLAACALGIKRDDFEFLNEVKAGLKPVYVEKPVKEKALLIKNALNPKDNIKAFWSSPFWRDFLVKPSYLVYVGGSDSLIDELLYGLQNPARPLYIGQSDDMVIIEDLVAMDIERVFSLVAHSIVEGIYPGCELMKLPLKFENDGNTLIYTQTLSIPYNGEIKLDSEKELYKFGDEYVELF